MTYSGLFWMARLKVDRATNLITGVAEELEKYRQNPSLTHRIIIEPDGGFVGETTVECGPVSAAPIIGDVVHNLRASLDLMASEMARVTSGSDKNVYFPIADVESKLDERIKSKNFDKAGADAVALLKTFQPYRGGNIALRALHDLDIEDKHNALIPTATGFQTEMEVPFEDGIYLPDKATLRHIPESIKLAFPHDSPFAGDEVIPTLEMLVQLVETILEEFARMIAARL